MKKNEFLTPAPADYQWPRCPEADHFIESTIRTFLDKHAFARRLSERMKVETSTRFPSWVDHLRLPAKKTDRAELERMGFEEDKKVPRPKGTVVYRHPYADLPRLVLSTSFKEVGCAIMTEAIWQFLAAHSLTIPVDGEPYSLYRVAEMSEGNSDLLIVERRGSQTLIPDQQDRADSYLRNFERWAIRPRHFPSVLDGMKEMLRFAKHSVKEVGEGPASVIFLETERLYWQKRNRAAQVQRARQDRLGLGWANHDHHTFRSSRTPFPILMEILLALGFKKRERYFAGGGAGWGAQILEQPDSGLVIFADVDLAPSDLEVDFSRIALPELPKPRTVGLWCALHGESILEAGMHHLEAQFDFDQLRTDLKEKKIETMQPFSDFPFLRQAFTQAEMWRVAETRLQALVTQGKVSAEAAEQIKANGAVGSHLENLQRTEGFKGFNQRGVSDIITAVNPESQALKRPKAETDMDHKKSVAVVGAGKIGELIVALLSQKYEVTVYDQDLKRAKIAAGKTANARRVNANNEKTLTAHLRGKDLVVNACPLFMNLPIARAAHKAGASYIDLSEDVKSSKEIVKLAKHTKGYFVPRCGVAPGFIQIIAAHMMKPYDIVEKASLRVGALPENPTNALKYNLTWSTDGLINQYGNACEGVQNGEYKMLQPLEGYERVVIDGTEFEAFNTSGGLGTLAQSTNGKVKNLTYKTLRYIGHRDLMKFLLFDLKLNEYRTILKQVLESAVPTTNQDLVVVLCCVEGRKNGILTQQTYTKTIRHGDMFGKHWSAIQIITASSAASVADLVLTEQLPHKGYVRQEEIEFGPFCATRFGKVFTK